MHMTDYTQRSLNACASSLGLQKPFRLDGAPKRSVRRTTACAASGIDSTEKQRICIIGAGCAGMTAAWSLSRYPDKYEVGHPGLGRNNLHSGHSALK